jgi:hypothetical protein
MRGPQPNTARIAQVECAPRPSPQPVRCDPGTRLDRRLIGNLDFNDEAPIEVSKRRKRAVEVKAFTAVLGRDAAAAGLAVIGAIALDRFGDQLLNVRRLLRSIGSDP